MLPLRNLIELVFSTPSQVFYPLLFFNCLQFQNPNINQKAKITDVNNSIGIEPYLTIKAGAARSK